MPYRKSISLTLLLVLAGAPAFSQGGGFRPQGRPGQSGQRNPGKRGRRGEWLRKYKELPPQEQEKSLTSDPEFQKLPPERQQKLRERLQQFNNLPPQQKERIVRRMEAFDRLTPEQQQSARELHSKLQNIPEDRRKLMRRALRDLRQMDPQQREQTMNSAQFKTAFNDNEREVIKGMAELPIGPGAQSEAPKR